MRFTGHFAPRAINGVVAVILRFSQAAGLQVVLGLRGKGGWVEFVIVV